ncbi:hypothetical protein MPTK1_7g16610 [Marchantia polymorpha subsp. ruderalis]|nr:hypothetical protein MARPO_0365s0001 [Marchantia polymorpha]BBN17734.1 hypothetical protein Mp_7g16610 [Marchantia polymorpha subsp. ruderalis]|eukprot:PTQ26791.1 hypothetical protein MARPO_0365s0001 [Marchantia polymorpha]
MREETVYIAKLAEEAKRFDDMQKAMEKLVRNISDGELTDEERILLFRGYKNVFGASRKSWKILSSIEAEQAKKKGDHDRTQADAELLREYKREIELEMSGLCDNVFSLLDTLLIPTSTTAESKVFFLKMKADFLRYVTEFKTGAEAKEAADTTRLTYETAYDIAEKELAPTHPCRLGLMLNFSVFFYEILKSPDHACRLAKRAFEEAVELEESNEDSIHIIDLLRNNFTVWTSGRHDEAGIKEKSKSQELPERG